ncbi:MAG: hypothetical protein B6D64_05770 [Bacteroidetes bacterium 4484_276]|nr:MAG: hypothetical protein B6D64_05770 [Bacteroidetes bacterium 4484_276]
MPIYPNPTTGIFKIDGLEEPSTIKIFNAFGNEVKLIEWLQSGEIDLTGQPRGVYFISVESEKGMCFEKVVLN